MKIGTRILAAATSVALLATGANAADVKLVTGNEYKPYTDESLPEGGLATELVREAYEQAGHTVVIEFMPWKRGYRSALKGRYTATFPYVVTEERQAEMLYSDPIYTTQALVAVAADFDRSIDDFDDLKGLMYCIPIGYSPTERISQMADAGEVEARQPQNMASCLRMLQAGRVDFLPLEKPTVIDAAKQTLGSTDAIRFGNLVLDETPLHLIFGKEVKSSEEAVATFNDALAALKARDIYQEIVDKHIQ